MAPKLAEFVFIKNTNPHDGSYRIEPALVVGVHTPDEGEWTANGEVVDLRSFGVDGVDTVGFQAGPATYDSNDVWNGGYALTPDGPEVESLANAPIVAPVVENPTTQATAGVSVSQVQAMIAAGNNSLLDQIRGLIQPPAQVDPANADPVADPEAAHTAS